MSVPLSPGPEFKDRVFRSCCTTHTYVNKLSFTWTINSVSYRPERVGEALESCNFSARTDDVTKWRLRIYLKGEPAQRGKVCALYLVLISCSKAEVHAAFTFSILNVKRTIAYSREEPVAEFVQGESKGYVRFIERNVLLDETRGLLVDDNLTICCEIRVVGESINVPGQSFPVILEVPQCQLSEDFGRLFVTREFSDVTLLANGRCYFAHKNILSVHSSVFAAMFEHDMEESTENKVCIKGIDHETMVEMLEFIYCGKTPNIENVAAALLVAADRYDLDRLKIVCENALELSVDNVVDALKLADVYSASQLKTRAIDFIALHHADVMNTFAWKELEQQKCYLVTEVNAALTACKAPCHLEEVSQTLPSLGRVEISAAQPAQTLCNKAQTIKLSHTWTVDNFSLHKEESEQAIESSTFSSGASDASTWCMMLYPRGVRKTYERNVSLYLKLVSSNKPEVQAQFILSALDSHLVREPIVYVNENDIFKFSKAADKRGYPDFLERKTLLEELNGILIDDKIMFHCDLSILSEPLDVCYDNCDSKLKVHNCCLSRNLVKLLESPKFSDVTLYVDGHDIYAHKNILSARSPIFADKFKDKKRERGIEQSKTVIITGVKYDVMKKMLYFIYTDNTPCLEKNVQDLFVAAIKYALPRLKVMCEEAMCSKLSVDDINYAWELLALANLHSADQLKTHVIDFMCCHASIVSSCSDWKNLEENHSNLVTEVFRAFIKLYSPPDSCMGIS